MAAFIIAAAVELGTLAACALMIFGAGMSDSPSAAADVPVKSTFFIGTGLAGLIAASHWFPHIGW